MLRGPSEINNRERVAKYTFKSHGSPSDTLNLQSVNSATGCDGLKLDGGDTRTILLHRASTDVS